MTGRQLRKTLIDLGVSQVDFAEFIGVDQRTVRAWIGGLYPVPRYAVIIINRLVVGDTIEDINASITLEKQHR